MSTLITRKEAVDATMKAFLHAEYKPGAVDCAVVADVHLKALGLDAGLKDFRKYSSIQDGFKSLKQRGFADTADWMDSLGLPRIVRSRSIAGDIWGYPSASGMTALVVYMGSDKVLAFHPNATDTPRLFVVAVVVPPTVCWSVTSCLRSLQQ